MRINGSKRNYFLLVGFVLLFLSLSPISNYNKARATCAQGFAHCSCDDTQTCETNINTDSNNCGSCGHQCAAGASCVNQQCTVPPAPTGGLVPCGRLADNPDTQNIDERAPCNLCAFFYMTKNIVNYILILAIAITVLIVVIAGVLFLFSLENPRNVDSAKSAITAAVMGLAIIFSGWLLVALFLQLIGYQNVATWNQVNCQLTSNWTPPTTCGDGTVQTSEECDPSESWTNFSARKPNATKKDWVETIYRCNPLTCTLGCSTLASDIGTGCYLTANGCDKGKYVCDFTNNTKKCVNVFSDSNYKYLPEKGCPVKDYCCTNDANDKARLASGTIMGTPFVVVNPFSSNGTYKCDDVCKGQGKICVGVGLKNPANNSCVYIVHDLGADCDSPSNQGQNDCKTPYYAGNSPRYPGWIGTCRDSEGVSFYVGETGCYCWSP